MTSEQEENNLEGLSDLFTPEEEREINESSFIHFFNAIAEGVYETAKKTGWWDNPRNEGEQHALFHSEISESLEAIRNGNPPDDKIPDFKGSEAELADAIIRIMDYGKGFGYNIAEALIAKINYNKTRERMHGGKKF